ncbi:hypothetical protein RND81_12G100300 [Saponaria officinalis]|uniref:Uncharacterized protein n=1 Tax=Saponaria officinalis TaxID=3572 RepID=A0AAW1H8U3_SAPOF
MTWENDQAREYQRKIDMIRDNALDFVNRLNLIFPESVYMNMLSCPPSLPILTAIISGNANNVLTSPPGNNVSFGNILCLSLLVQQYFIICICCFYILFF